MCAAEERVAEAVWPEALAAFRTAQMERAQEEEEDGTPIPISLVLDADAAIVDKSSVKDLQRVRNAVKTETASWEIAISALTWSTSRAPWSS